jgi:hypothetical protein
MGIRGANLSTNDQLSTILPLIQEGNPRSYQNVRTSLSIMVTTISCGVYSEMLREEPLQEG